jgi:hypothetical protein
LPELLLPQQKTEPAESTAQAVLFPIARSTTVEAEIPPPQTVTGFAVGGTVPAAL